VAKKITLGKEWAYKNNQKEWQEFKKKGEEVTQERQKTARKKLHRPEKD